MFKLNKKCDLTYDQALDTTKTIIGLNWADLQKPMGAEAIEIRDAVAKTIVDNLFNKETKKIYTVAIRR